ncbi:MAG: ABC transporter permease [Patescibacteria group bacterium]
MLKWRKILAVFSKELTDLIRDSRTILISIIMPLLIFPLMIVVSTKITVSQQKHIVDAPVRLVIQGESVRLHEFLASNTKVLILTVQDINQALHDEKIDAALIIPKDFDDPLAHGANPGLTIRVMSTKPYSAFALTKLSGLLSTFNNQLIRERLTAANTNPDLINGPIILKDDISTQQEKSGSYLAFLLPIFLVILSYNSGAYTAMDLISGEKERRTLESLLMVPLNRTSILTGKLLAISAVACLTVILATLSLYTSMRFLPLPEDAGAISMSPGSLATLIGMGIVLAVMFSTILTALSVFARSLKEAQSYMAPLYLVVILPATMVNIIPKQVVPDHYFVVPVVNALFFFREILLHTINVRHAWLTVLTLLFFSAGMFVLSVRLFDQENVIERSL